MLYDQLLRVQDWHVSARKRGKGGKVREPWKTREVVNLVKKNKKTNVRCWEIKSGRDFEE